MHCYRAGRAGEARERDVRGRNMSNARTFVHYMRMVVEQSGGKWTSDAEMELTDVFENIETRIDNLESEVRDIRRQVPDNR